MRVRAAGVLLALVLVLSAESRAPAGAQQTECDASVQLDECLVEAEVLRALLDVEVYKAELFRLLNEWRTARLDPVTLLPKTFHPPLRRVERLERAAQRHSDAMRDGTAGGPAQTWHNGSDGTPVTRMTFAGYVPVLSWGENVSSGQRTPRQVMLDWWNSPTHKAEILHPSHQDVGLGLAAGPATGDPMHLWWTAAFGRSAFQHTGIRTTIYNSVPDPYYWTQFLLNLLRQAEEAYCKGNKKAFKDSFGEFMDQWVQLGLLNAPGNLTGRVGQCLRDWLGAHSEDEIESDLVKGWRLSDQ